MYKPPGWRLIEDARRTLPNAVAALGTVDETTLLIIGRDAALASLEAHATTTKLELQAIYGNYRPLSSSRTTVAGFPAIEHRFRGTAEGHDWSVTAITLARGNDVYTILAMTYGYSDLIQIQENVIAKTIASLQFTSSR